MPSIAMVSEGDLAELLPLMRAYCDFYEVTPSDEALLDLSRALINDSAAEGIQFIGRGDDGTAIGFATLFWSWATTSGGRQGIMHDLFVTKAARGTGIARSLIDNCVEAAQARGCVALIWSTALDNHRAQALYDRTGAAKSTWHEYAIEFEL